MPKRRFLCNVSPQLSNMMKWLLVCSWLLHVIQTCLHVLQVTLGYMLMLCVMSYNVWIFLGVVLGSALGYYVAFPLLGQMSLYGRVRHWTGDEKSLSLDSTASLQRAASQWLAQNSPVPGNQNRRSRPGSVYQARADENTNNVVCLAAGLMGCYVKTYHVRSCVCVCVEKNSFCSLLSCFSNKS